MNDSRDSILDHPARFPRRLKRFSGIAEHKARSGHYLTPMGASTGYARQTAPPPLRLTEEQLASLCREFQALKARIEREAPQDVKLAALQHTEELEAAILYECVPGKTLSKLKTILAWFSEQLPAIAVAVSNLAVRPLADRRVDSGRTSPGRQGRLR